MPRATTSSRPASHAQAAGSEVSTPPSDSQPLQPPSYHLCHSALSVPRAKTSIRPGPHDTAAGEEVSVPSSDSQSLQPLSYHLCHSALSVPRPNTSSRPGAQELAPGPEVRTPPWLSQSIHVMPASFGERSCGRVASLPARVGARGKFQWPSWSTLIVAKSGSEAPCRRAPLAASSRR